MSFWEQAGPGAGCGDLNCPRRAEEYTGGKHPHQQQSKWFKWLKQGDKVKNFVLNIG